MMQPDVGGSRPAVVSGETAVVSPRPLRNAGGRDVARLGRRRRAANRRSQQKVATCLHSNVYGVVTCEQKQCWQAHCGIGKTVVQ